ncbi:hypothetical protein STCU_06306 [Strigomonas culicis]|uniref:Solute carrier family 39 (Zinc transporter), member 1/2/3 n=1 Tax=Strigomonas culicis TaxID=28005 RepID=S9VSI6_9TRYP|nr:hypothetical protein STCU_06306 [Strigomonas culicis]|eukprot:EPY26130.1 hypothetical protein STCU_06306 [Strigomonas culicis]
MSTLGVLTPFCSFSVLRRCSSSHDPFFVVVRRLRASFMNCFSAGMLLTLALGHFLPSSFKADPSLSVEHLCSYVLIGVLFPLLLELLLGGEGSHSHGSHHHHHHHHDDDGSGSRRRRAISTTVILILLMGFHGMIEGMLLGLEKHPDLLWRVAFPLTIHKYFDGIVIGVSVAKDRAKAIQEAESTATEVESPNEEDEKKDLKAASVMRSMSVFVIGWLAITPVTMLCVVFYNLFKSAQSTAGKGSSQHDASSSASFLFAFVQAAGGGSFIYVSLSILFQEREKGVFSCVAVITGVLFTLLLFNFPESHSM